jgi:hypothetical protein
MAILKLGGKLFAEHNEQTDTISLASDVVLPSIPVPAGQILQVLHGYYDTATTVGGTHINIVDLTGTAKGKNSKFIAHWILVAGGHLDAHGHLVRIYLQSGNATTDTGSDLMQSSAGWSGAFTYGEDVPGTADGQGHSGQYSIRTISGTTAKTMNFEKGDPFAVGFWVRGDSTLYLNRSYNRSSHESGISSLTLYEIAV